MKKVSERETNSVVLKREIRSNGYPPAEGRVEHSQRNSSQENYVIFSLQGKKRTTEEERVKKDKEDGSTRREGAQEKQKK